MPDPIQALTAWAEQNPAIQAVVLIGSRVRATAADAGGADEASDWDFHFITSSPRIFADADWLRAAGWAQPLAYVDRMGVLGRSKKVTAVLPGAELDGVILPASQLRLAKLAMALGWHRRSPALRRALGDLAIVIRPGYRFIHGEERWGDFYRRVVAEVADPRLGDAEVRRLAEGFVCDYVWIERKLARGELITARRMLHRALAEVNFQLAHELKLRRGERSFPDARRLELIGTREEADRLAVLADGTAEGIRIAARQSAVTLNQLMDELSEGTWRFPLPL